MLSSLWSIISHEEMLWTHELISAVSTDADLRDAIAPVILAHDERIERGLPSLMELCGIPPQHGEYVANITRWAIGSYVVRDIAVGFTGGHQRLLNYLELIADRIFGPLPAVAQEVAE
jgi:hypothetical protein